jgi:hypothetical protein
MSTVRNAAGPFCRRLYLHENHIEDTCRAALAAVGLMPSSPGPIRIERFIFLHFGIEEEYESMPEHIMGCAKFTRQGLRRIMISRELAEQEDVVSKFRVRSTLAHEAGHGLFHTDLFVEKLNVESAGQLFGEEAGIVDSVTKDGFLCRAEGGMHGVVAKFEWWEYQANLAMAALLLPKHLVIEAARAELPDVLTGPGSFEDRLAEAENRLSSLFAVSRKMISIRLGPWWTEQSHQPPLF